MTTRRIPSIFPNVGLPEVGTRMLAKGSLIRKIAHAQNFLWAHGQVYLATGNEGNGYSITNKDDPAEFEIIPTTPPTEGALCVCTFYLPPNWNKTNKIKISFQTGLSALCTGNVWAIIEDRSGSYISRASYAVSAGINDGSITIDTPVSGEYQVRVLINFVDGGSIVSAAGTRSLGIMHVSARYLNDPDVDQTYFPMPEDLFSNDYPLASVFLNKLLRNTLHLWGTRTPEICQAYLARNYWNTSTFTQVARYITWIPDRVQDVGGRLTVWCTHGGAGNEIRITDGTTTQTFTALSAGLNELNISGFNVTGNAEKTFTIEAKSTAASADWGTLLLGVQIWENSTDLSSPANYEPLDEEGLDGDDTITAQDVNVFNQRAGIRKLLNNDLWLAANRLRNIVGDWLHRTYKRGPRFSAPDDKNFDPRIDWTRGPNLVDYQVGRPRNITIMSDGSDFNTDSLGTFPYGEEDAQSGYNESTPYTFPYSFTFNGHGARLAHAYIRQAGGSQIFVAARSRRVAPFMFTNDGTGFGPLALDSLYAGKAYLLIDAGVNEYKMPFTAIIQNQFGNLLNTIGDRRPGWLGTVLGDHDTIPYSFKIVGRLPSQSGGTLPKDNRPAVPPEGTLFEVELNSMYVSDGVLTEDNLADLA